MAKKLPKRDEASKGQRDDEALGSPGVEPTEIPLIGEPLDVDWPPDTPERAERYREHRRKAFAASFKGNWPELDPCPVALKDAEGRMDLSGTPLASAATPRDAVAYVHTAPAESAFLELVGRPDGAGRDEDIAAALKVLRFLVKACIMGAPADLAVLRNVADVADSEAARRARVLRCIVRAAEPFAAGDESQESVIKEGFERFPSRDRRDVGTLQDMIVRGEALAKEEPRINNSLRCMRRILAVYELREELAKIDDCFSKTEPRKVYGLLNDAVRRTEKKGRGNIGLAGVAARLASSVGAFADRREDQSRRAFRGALKTTKGRRC